MNRPDGVRADGRLRGTLAPQVNSVRGTRADQQGWQGEGAAGPGIPVHVVTAQRNRKQNELDIHGCAFRRPVYCTWHDGPRKPSRLAGPAPSWSSYQLGRHFSVVIRRGVARRVPPAAGCHTGGRAGAGGGRGAPRGGRRGWCSGPERAKAAGACSATADASRGQGAGAWVFNRQWGAHGECMPGAATRPSLVPALQALFLVGGPRRPLLGAKRPTRAPAAAGAGSAHRGHGLVLGDGPGPLGHCRELRGLNHETSGAAPRRLGSPNGDQPGASR